MAVVTSCLMLSAVAACSNAGTVATPTQLPTPTVTVAPTPILTDDERAYLGAVQDQLWRMDAPLRTIANLTVEPRIDREWRETFGEERDNMFAIFGEISRLDPPPRFATAHADYHEAVRLYQRALEGIGGQTLGYERYPDLSYEISPSAS